MQAADLASDDLSADPTVGRTMIVEDARPLALPSSWDALITKRFALMLFSAVALPIPARTSAYISGERAVFVNRGNEYLGSGCSPFYGRTWKGCAFFAQTRYFKRQSISAVIEISPRGCQNTQAWRLKTMIWGRDAFLSFSCLGGGWRWPRS